MAFTSKNLLALGAVVASFASFASASVVVKPDSIGKRSTLHERQTCRTSGWIPACPGLFACVPPGAICCSDGFTYAMPPQTCPDGTEPIATAITNAPPPVVTTPPPPPPAVEYTWYTYTITWYYWYYYYIYVDITSTRLVSTEYTTVTTISYSATDEAAASSYFKGFTATAVLPTPTQTNTPISGTPPPASSTPSYPTETPGETSTYELEPGSSSSSVVAPSYSTPPDNSSTTSAAPTSATTSPVTAGAGRPGASGVVGSWAPMVGAIVVGLLSGVMMIAL